MVNITNIDTAHAAKNLRGGPGHARSIASFGRANNATAYASGDVISSEVATTVIAFPNCAGVLGGSGAVLGATVAHADIPAAQPELELYLFNEAPTGISDNAALAVSDADMVNLIGVIDLAVADQKIVGADQTFYISGEVVLPFVCESTTAVLYGLLVTRTIFTPEAEAKFIVGLELLRD